MLQVLSSNQGNTKWKEMSANLISLIRTLREWFNTIYF